MIQFHGGKPMSSIVSDSILVSIKQMFWPDVTEGTNMPFDAELIIHINSIFVDVCNLGIGPEAPYKITGESETWTSFFSDIDLVNNVKEYFFLRLKLLFDPPQNSFLVKSIEDQIQKMEWHLVLASDKMEGRV